MFSFYTISAALLLSLCLGRDLATRPCGVLWRGGGAVYGVDPVRGDKEASAISTDLNCLALFFQSAILKHQQLNVLRDVVRFNMGVSIFMADTALSCINLVKVISYFLENLRRSSLVIISCPTCVRDKCNTENGENLLVVNVLFIEGFQKRSYSLKFNELFNLRWR